MTSQPIASSRPAPSVSGSARHRRLRTAAAIAAIAALLAAGGYLAATTIGPDTASPPRGSNTEVHTSAQKLRDLRTSIAGQYGSRPAAHPAVNPSAQTLRELRLSIAGQYGSQAVADATVHPNAQVRRELRESVAGQYGPAR
jgi:hypothetical protein